MIAWAIDAMIGVTLLLLLVLALRRPVARLFGAEWAYALWLLPLLRLAMPPLELFAKDAVPVLPTYTVIIIPAAAETAVPGSVASGFDWPLFALALWAGGALLFLLWQKMNYTLFLLSLGKGRHSRPADHGGIPVVESDAADGPLAVGLLQPRIVVPLDFTTRYSPAERTLALDHELIHHRRGDLWWNLLALAMLALNWFNPLAWIAFRAFRADQELACDAAVARRRSLAERHEYACALVKSATRGRQVAACPLNGADQLKQRLKMMREHRVSRPRTMGGMAALAALAASGIVISGAGFAKQEQKRTTAELIVANMEESDPIIAAQDVATLADKCGGDEWDGRVSIQATGADGRQVVVCGNGQTLDDAQVGEILNRTVERAKARGNAVIAEVSSASATTPSASAAKEGEASPPAHLSRRVAEFYVRPAGVEGLTSARPAPALLVQAGRAPIAIHAREEIMSALASAPSLPPEEMKIWIAGQNAAAGREDTVEVSRLQNLAPERRAAIERLINEHVATMDHPAGEAANQVRVFKVQHRL